MKKYSLLAMFAVVFGLYSCQDVDLEPNLNNPPGNEFVELPVEGAASDDLLTTMNGAGERIFNFMVGFDGIYADLMADQITTTNAYADFWTYTMNPRQRTLNSTSNSNLFVLSGPWDECYTVINNTNNALNRIEAFNNTVTVNGTDKTQTTLASAHFLKGLALGYLGIIYDQAYYTNYDIPLSELVFSPYGEIVDKALMHIDESIAIASADANFEFESLPGTELSKAEFLQLANSMAARISLAKARTKAEASELDYAKILAYAEKGFTSDFEPNSVQDTFLSNYQDWTLYTLSDGAGYLPTDIKIPHLMDSSYPSIYPLDETVILDPASTADPRLEMYYDYTKAFGFLRASRDRSLFTNYRHTRYFNDNNENVTGIPVQVFMKAEIDYIKAECMLGMGNASGAASVLNSSPRSTVGGITTPSSDVENALLYEYSVELDKAAGIWTHMAFMRRHDMLQVGTPTMFPVPASELEITGIPFYNFGGVRFAGEPGSANGDNFWRN